MVQDISNPISSVSSPITTIYPSSTSLPTPGLEIPERPLINEQSNSIPLISVTCLLFICVIIILSGYGNIKSQPWYVTIVCIIGWFLPFWIVVLLPLDLASTVQDEKKGRVPFAYASQSFLFVAWRVIYWTSFCLTWLMIPMMQAYVNTGDFTVTKRLKSALHVNIRFYSIYVVVGIIGLFYLVFGNGLTTREGIQSYVMAAANSWGLFLVIVFMGYGLVSLPRSLWYSGDYDRHLHQHYANAVKLKEECLDTEIEFTELAKTMNAISKRSTAELPETRHCISIMLQRFPFVLHGTFSVTERELNSSSSISIPRVLTEDFLVKLTRRMIIAIRMKDRKSALYKNLLNEAFYLQDIISNKDKKDRQFVSSLRRGNEENTLWNRLTSNIEWWWILRISPFINKILAILFSVVSVCIIWSELVFNVRKPVIISIVYYILNACGTNYAALEIVAFLTLMFMCICIYSSLFKIRFFNLYLLIPNHHTDENSLLWFTSYMCKMMAPLCYNFINLAVDAPGVNNAIFTTFMGKAELIKFLGAFADWFPIIILIPAISLLFNIQGRCLRICGIKSPYQYSEDDDIDHQDDAESNWGALMDADYEEGAKLVKEERKQRERDINPSATRNSTTNTRSRDYTNRKYHRAVPPDTIRSERDRRVDEILSGESNSASPEHYHDESSGTSSPRSLTPQLNNQPVDASKLKNNLLSLGDTVKSRFGGLFHSLNMSNDFNINTTATDASASLQQQQPEQLDGELEPYNLNRSFLNDSTSANPYASFNAANIKRGERAGRVFGRPVTNENYRPFNGISRHSSNGISPFARLDETSNNSATSVDSPNRPSTGRNIFDNI